MNIIFRNNIIILGTKEILIVKVTIENKGENAYFTELELEYPEQLRLVGQSKCIDQVSAEDEKTVKRCSVKDPLKANTTVKSNQLM